MPAIRSGAPLAVLLLAGCTLGPDYRQPVLPSPPGWTGSSPSPAVASNPVVEPVETRWWASFGDPVLTGLVTRAAKGNLDVEAAVARLEQSRAQLRITGADRYPRITGNASYVRERLSPGGVIGQIGGGSGAGSNPTGVPTNVSRSGRIPPFDLWQYGFDASWELDLWGRVRRSVESARASAEAEDEARHDVLLSTVAEVARDYLQLRGTQAGLRIARDRLASERRSMALAAERGRRGLVSTIDEQQARAQVEATAADIPQLEQREAQLINAIGLLVGAYPQALRPELRAPAALPTVPPRVPIGLPSELVGRRPDVRKASARLHAATANIGVAKADFLPRITLSGNLNIQTTRFAGLDDLANRTYGFGPGISVPIFQGARLRGTLALREAELRERSAEYRKTVLAAFRDVDDALTSFAGEQRRRDRLAAETEASRTTLMLAEQRYRHGFTSYIDVLTAERSYLDSQRELADSNATIATDLVSLFKALGGGWDAPELAMTAPDR